MSLVKHHIKRYIIHYFIALLFLSSCRQQAEIPCIDNDSDELQIKLTEGNPRYLVKIGALLLFDTIVEDSRCPLNTYCVWEGEVEIRVRIAPTKQQQFSFNLKNTEDGKIGNIHGSRYRFELLDVDPYPDEVTIQKLHTAKLHIQRICDQDRCDLHPDPGPCYAAFIRYYYDQDEKKCKSFTYGGCDGVVPFETLEECQACETGKQSE